MSKERKTPADPEKIDFMIKNFHKEWNEGKSIKTIAKIFGVHNTTIRNHLKEIAELNGVPVESYYTRKPCKRVKAISNVNTLEGSNSAKSEVKSLSENPNGFLVKSSEVNLAEVNLAEAVEVSFNNILREIGNIKEAINNMLKEEGI